jgi:hypothetical protein
MEQIAHRKWPTAVRSQPSAIIYQPEATGYKPYSIVTFVVIFQRNRGSLLSGWITTT